MGVCKFKSLQDLNKNRLQTFAKRKKHQTKTEGLLVLSTPLYARKTWTLTVRLKKNTNNTNQVLPKNIKYKQNMDI